MWTTACSNKICFTQEKTLEQNLHLKRLFFIRPQINIEEPYVPRFLRVKGSQKENKRQIQNKIDKDNNILEKKILEIYFKNGKYSKYEVEPKQIYPAFRRYSNFKFDEIMRILNINFDNYRFQNKIINLKPNYDYGEMRKEAEKQEKYLYNILNRPKSIPFAPALNFISIEQLHNRLKNSFLKQKQNLTDQQSIKSKNRGNSAIQMRTKSNDSKINKSTDENNISDNKNNRSKRSQSSKNKKTLNLNNEIQTENSKDHDKKVKKETGTTKCNTENKN